MRRYNHEGIFYLQLEATAMWKNWRLTEPAHAGRVPPVLLLGVREWLQQHPTVKYYVDPISRMPTFSFPSKALETEFMAQYLPQGMR